MPDKNIHNGSPLADLAMEQIFYRGEFAVIGMDVDEAGVPTVSITDEYPEMRTQKPVSCTVLAELIKDNSKVEQYLLGRLNEITSDRSISPISEINPELIERFKEQARPFASEHRPQTEAMAAILSENIPEELEIMRLAANGFQTNRIFFSPKVKGFFEPGNPNIQDGYVGIHCRNTNNLVIGTEENDLFVNPTAVATHEAIHGIDAIVAFNNFKPGVLGSDLYLSSKIVPDNALKSILKESKGLALELQYRSEYGVGDDEVAKLIPDLEKKLFPKKSGHLRDEKAQILEIMGVAFGDIMEIHRAEAPTKEVMARVGEIFYTTTAKIRKLFPDMEREEAMRRTLEAMKVFSPTAAKVIADYRKELPGLLAELRQKQAQQKTEPVSKPRAAVAAMDFSEARVELDEDYIWKKIRKEEGLRLENEIFEAAGDTTMGFKDFRLAELEQWLNDYNSNKVERDLATRLGLMEDPVEFLDNLRTVRENLLESGVDFNSDAMVKLAYHIYEIEKHFRSTELLLEEETPEPDFEQLEPSLTVDEVFAAVDALESEIPGILEELRNIDSAKLGCSTRVMGWIDDYHIIEADKGDWPLGVAEMIKNPGTLTALQEIVRILEEKAIAAPDSILRIELGEIIRDVEFWIKYNKQFPDPTDLDAGDTLIEQGPRRMQESGRTNAG